MKNCLLIKLNELVVDTCTLCDKAAKKSIEFFLGRMISDEEMDDFRANSGSDDRKKLIENVLNKEGRFIRENAINKKFNEYFLGKDFKGLIREAGLLVSSKSLSKMEKHGIILLSTMPEEETNFIKDKLGIKAKAICCNDVREGLEKAKRKLSKFSYVSNSMEDYNAAAEKGIPFIAVGIKENIEGEKVKNVEELL